MAFLCENNEIEEREIKESPVLNCASENQIPNNYFNKRNEDLEKENYKTLLTEIKDMRKCKYMPYSRENIVKITSLPKVFYIFNTVPIRTPNNRSNVWTFI